MTDYSQIARDDYSDGVNYDNFSSEPPQCRRGECSRMAEWRGLCDMHAPL